MFCIDISIKGHMDILSEMKMRDDKLVAIPFTAATVCSLEGSSSSSEDDVPLAQLMSKGPENLDGEYN